MIIKVAPDLRKLEVWANGTELASVMGKDRKNGHRVLTYPQSKKLFVHEFKNPILLTDHYRISKLNPTFRDTLFSLYASLPRIVEYDGVSVFNDSSHVNVWAPSVDTILFAKALRKVLGKRKFKTAAEIGCGSGFLSKYILAKDKNIQLMLINDINPYAVKCAKDNIKDKRTVFCTGDGLAKIKGKKFDLVICNPPYVPRPDERGENPYEGIRLLDHFVHEGQRYLKPGGIIITNVSSLCWNIIFRKKPKMKMKLLEKMTVPLKVNNILNNANWLLYLTKHGLKRQYKHGYEYWQDLNIIMLMN